MAQTDVHDWLRGVARVASAVNEPVSLPELLNLVSATACQLMGYDFCAVFLPDPTRKVLELRGSHGLSSKYIEAVNRHHPVDLVGPAGGAAPSTRAFQSGEPVQIADTGSDLTFRPWSQGAQQQGFTSMVAVPLMVSNVALGTLDCYTAQTHEFIPAELDLLRTLASQVGNAIVTFELRATEAQTIADLRTLNTALEEQHDLLRQSDEIHQRLTEVALHEGGVAGVTRTLSELVRLPVVVDDKDGVVLSSAAHGDTQLHLPEAIARERHLERLPLDRLHSGHVLTVPGSANDESLGSWMVASVLLGKETVARIWLPGDVEMLGDLGERAVEHAATVLALELLRVRTAQEVEWRLSGEIVHALLNADAAALTSVLSRAERLGHDLSRPHAVLIAKPETSRDGAHAKALSVVRSEAAHTRPLPLTSTVGEYVIALWPHTTESDVTNAAAKMRSTFGRGDTDTLLIAVGPDCHALNEYPRSFRLARGAVELARLRGHGDRLIKLDSLGPYGLLLQLEHTSELVAFGNDALRPLRQHDERREANLEQTLRAYLRRDRNTAATAADLFVHPNTVGLRIRKAEELMMLSLRETHSLVHVALALMADDVVAVTAEGTVPDES